MKWKTIRKWISNFITILMFGILILMLFFLISAKLTGGEPNFFGYQLKAVLSGSMEPGIKTGSLIVVEPVEKTDQFKKNDIITFINENNLLVTHRITEVIHNGDQVLYRTRGDNNDSEDLNPVRSQNVVAVYTGITIPYLGYIVQFAQSKNGILYLVILPGVLLIIYSVIMLRRVFSELEKQQKNQNLNLDQSTPPSRE
ncbi:signal peptidase I SipW [Fervidibacillus halotolerans]|uniref:Signal peptidase I n=1 Tax=Fervidibacillus halotolerans TaxID=2980027 RepID=A0A9E8LYC6_9BACI|nr:signal peptidase I [Fervidibacillus halotolerans]WAA11839.1 signal peptidase I [Fervidibacillus halotolerans]